MQSLSDGNQSEVIEAFNSTPRYLDDLLDIDNNFFDSVINQIYPSELQLNKTKVSDSESSVLDWHLSISDGFVTTKIFDKRDDFDFDNIIVNFPFLELWCSPFDNLWCLYFSTYSFCSSTQSCWWL